jgi:hypothetical protein
MRIQVGLELNNEGRALAWALDFPGCFAYGGDGPEAIIALARALVQYEQWGARRAGAGWLALGDFDLRLVDTWEVYTVNDAYDVVEDGYAVNAWFRHDWKPLSAAEVERGLMLLDWSRADLLEMARPLSEQTLDRTYPGERWSIRGILKHVGGAEWWYLDRLGLAGVLRDTLPKGALERMAHTRARLRQVLPELVGQPLVVGTEGEFWSPRKLLRRALWHEMDHYVHIQRLLGISLNAS